MLCVCARGGTSFARTNDICDTAAAIIGWNEICVYKTQPIDWTIIRCSDIKLYWSLSVNFRYTKNIRFEIVWIVNHFQTAKNKNDFVVKQKENLKKSCSKSQNKRSRKLSVSKLTEEKVILLSLTKEKSKNKKINQNVRKNECKFYRCWCCFRHHLHQ